MIIIRCEKYETRGGKFFNEIIYTDDEKIFKKFWACKNAFSFFFHSDVMKIL